LTVYKVIAKIIRLTFFGPFCTSGLPHKPLKIFKHSSVLCTENYYGNQQANRTETLKATSHTHAVSIFWRYSKSGF